MASLYTKTANRKGLAQRAIGKIENAQRPHPLQAVRGNAKKEQ